MTQTTPALRILVVDDNRGDRGLIIRELQRAFPHLQAEEILDANGLAQALDNSKFDLVVTDYQLRWTTGTEVLRAIKRRYPDCPVIMFTGTGNEEVAVEAMKAGLDDYVLKEPNRFIRLPAAVQVALERAANQRRAAQIEIQFRKLLDRLTVAVFRVNAAGELLECNPVFLRLLGVRTLEQAQATSSLDLQQIYNRAAEQPLKAQYWEMELRRSDGTVIWVLLSVTLSSNGEPLLDGILEDITARKQAELELRQLTDSLERRVQERTAQLETSNRELTLANQALEQFAYSVSHDLREPLRSIQGFGQLLLDSLHEQLNSEDQEALNQILESARQGDRLIQDLLSYSQLSRIEIPIQPINLSLLLTEILGQLQSEIHRQQAQIQVEEPLGEVMANRSVLFQVLTNLIGNAIKFVAPGQSPHVRIWSDVALTPSPAQSYQPYQVGQGNPAEQADQTAQVDQTEQGIQPDPQSTHRIRLWVEDNGIGIAQEYHQRIFDVFVRLHGSEIYPGTGIGLATVRRGVERLGGRVGVESQVGQGSRFWIELPQFRA